MKMSNMLVSTLREVPAEAEIDSHKLMLRAGMIRKMAAGIYNYMPLGLKALKNVEEIVREEMNAAGAQEFLASAMLPAELWQESGRWDVYGAEMFRLKDRNNRDYCLGPTHEEVFTDIARTEIKSYKQLPVNLYQIQTKYRDERRPRFGVMRSREFVMKDAYSFDKDQAGLDASYDKMHAAYINIFNRCGIDAKCVEADSGAIGGSNSAEFMVKSEVGEDDVVFCTCCNYAANIEKAPSTVEVAEVEELKETIKTETPNARTIEDLVKFFNTTEKKFAKTLIYNADGRIVAVIVRGDREVNEVKVSNALGGIINLDMASAEEVFAATNAQIGFAGPIGIKVDELLVDEEVSKMYNFILGANETGYHIENVNYGRDFTGTVGDFRNITAGEKCPECGGEVTISRGTEVGHIFKLGTKYSEAMNATFIDENGKEVTKDIIEAMYEGKDMGIPANIHDIPFFKEQLLQMNMIPCGYHRYYYREEEMLAHGLEEYNDPKVGTRGQQVQQTEHELFELYKNPDLDHKPEQLAKRGGAHYSDAACETIASIYGNKLSHIVVTTKNNGSVPDLPADCAVEVSAYIGSTGARAIAFGPLQPAQRGWLQCMKNMELCVEEAAVTGDYGLLMQAFILNPQTVSGQKMVNVLNELLIAHEKYLPQFADKIAELKAAGVTIKDDVARELTEKGL